MPTVTSCPSCAAKFRVDEKFAGKKVRCPKCAATIQIPAAEGTTTLPAPAPIPVVKPAPKVASSPAAKPVAKPLPKAAPVKPLPTAHVVDSPAPEAFPMPSFPAVSVGPVVNTTTGGVASSAANVGAKKGLSPALLALVGGALIGVLLIGGIGGYFLLSSPSKQTVAKGGKGKGKETVSAADKATVIIKWGSAERVGSQMTLDGTKQAIPPDGEVVLQVSPGKHQLALKRRSYETVIETFEVAAAGTHEFEPKWVEVPTLATNNPSGTNTPGTFPVPSSTGTQFRPGSAVLVRGFEGWQQSIPDGVTVASRENKDLVIVFGSSDGSIKTAKLAAQFVAQGMVGGELAKKFVPVVIDLPLTPNGRNMVQDLRGNLMLARDYGIDDIAEVPVLVLADSQGRPYGVERKWENGTGELASIMAKIESEKGERDALLAETKSGADPLAAAAKLGDWVIARKLWWHYRNDIQQWYGIASKDDPANASGKLESLLEGEFFIRLRKLNPGDVVALTQTLALLDPFVKPNRFQNQDRGARLHFIVGSIYMQVDEHDEGLQHFERALSYQPADADLKQQLEQVKFLVSNKNILGNGSGYMIADGGYILTNRHVVEGPGKITVRLPGSKEALPAKALKIDEQLDVALLKIEVPADATFTPLPFTAIVPELSMEVAAYGFPNASALGDALKATSGTVASLPTESTENMLLLDLKVNPGNSGGPLIDKYGTIAGMVTAKTGTYSLQDSYGLAIPASDIKTFLAQHLPAGVNIASSSRGEEYRNWAEVTRQVQGSVVMILKVR